MNAFEAPSKTETTPKSLRKLEIGTSNGSSGILRAFPGYDPRSFVNGTEITTVDLPSRFGDPHHYVEWRTEADDIIDPSDLKSVYDPESVWLSATKDDFPRYEHNAVIADGRNLPFADESFGQSLMFNVMGDASVDTDSAKLLVLEALRVSDELMIVEDRTPFVAADTFASIDFQKMGVTIKNLLEHPDDRSDYETRKATVRSNNILDIYILTKNDDWLADIPSPTALQEQLVEDKPKSNLGKIATKIFRSRR